MYPIDMKEIAGSIGFLQPVDTIVFSVNPEDVTPTASRRQLQYTSTTKRALSAMIAAFEANFVAEVQAKVDAASCYFQGCTIFRDATSHLGVNRVSGLREKVTWGASRSGPRSPTSDAARRRLEQVRALQQGPRRPGERLPAATKVVVEHNPPTLARPLPGPSISSARTSCGPG